MSDLVLERATFGWDLQMDNGDFVMTTTDAESISQRVLYRLETWLRESPYDRSAGVPYELIFGQQPVEAVAALLIQEILDTEGVTNIVGVPSFVLTSDRVLTINITIRTENDIVPIQTEVVA
jgi:hypothetical protein